METNQQKKIETILLIDDHSEFLFPSLQLTAENKGYKLYAVKNVLEGLKFISNNINILSAVILDYGFPKDEMQGLEALKEIKKINQDLPVIMLTGSDSANDIVRVVECMRNGAYNYVIKKIPLDIEYLFQMLKSAIFQYHRNQETERYNNLKEEYRIIAVVYEKMLYTTELIIRNLLCNELMFPPTFEKRIKEFNSFYNKIKKKEENENLITEPFKRIQDIAGMRVIFYNADDLQKAVKIIESNDDFIDFKNNTKLTADDKTQTDGYRAVHFDVKLNPSKRVNLVEYEDLKDIPCEVQLKTTFAHSWSKVHHALSYKGIETMRLTTEKRDQLNADFKDAAKNLESIEQQITELCKKYYPNIE
jgi:ppGpp synthetase/RelA/SpoT-type nucleotidyltranferase